MHAVDVYVGKRLKELRKINGISQTKLADGLDVSFQQIQKYIRVFRGSIPLINVVILFVIYMMRVILLYYVVAEYIHMM